MTLAQEIICPRCDHRFPLSRLLNLCTCGSPLLVRYDPKKASANFSISSLQGRVSSLWRYRELLPLRDDANLVSLGEGFTPLLPAKSLAAYAARAGIEAHVFMPRDTPIANQIEVQQYGARLTLVDGLINDCGRIIAEKKTSEGWF